MPMIEIGDEGRLMLTDHGDFILLNMYFPNGGRGGDRLVFKHRFQTVVELYCLDMVKQGRHVVMVGDFNIAHTDLDVWNPEVWFYRIGQEAVLTARARMSKARKRAASCRKNGRG